MAWKGCGYLGKGESFHLVRNAPVGFSYSELERDEEHQKILPSRVLGGKKPKHLFWIDESIPSNFISQNL